MVASILFQHKKLPKQYVVSHIKEKVRKRCSCQIKKNNPKTVTILARKLLYHQSLRKSTVRKSNHNFCAFKSSILNMKIIHFCDNATNAYICEYKCTTHKIMQFSILHSQPNYFYRHPWQPHICPCYHHGNSLNYSAVHFSRFSYNLLCTFNIICNHGNHTSLFLSPWQLNSSQFLQVLQ